MRSGGYTAALSSSKTDTAPVGPAALSARWDAAGSGSIYRDTRFGTTRAAERDPRMIARLLQRFPLEVGAPSVLDVPCGAGRLTPHLARGTRLLVGADASRSMLAAAAETASEHARASAWRLPFRAGAFDLVVCCRLFHHVATDAERVALLRELLRVADERVLVSFWDAGSLAAWRSRRRRARPGRRPETRVAITRRSMLALVQQAQGEVLGFTTSLRFISQQSFCALRGRRT